MCELSAAKLSAGGPSWVLDQMLKNEATDCKKLKKLPMGEGMCSGWKAGKCPAKVFSLSESCGKAGNIFGCPSASCSHLSQPGYPVLLLCVLQVL